MAREKAIEETRQHQQKTQNEINETQKAHMRSVEYEKQRLAQKNERDASNKARMAENEAAYQEQLNRSRMNYYGRTYPTNSVSQTQQVAYSGKRPEPGSVTQGYDHYKTQAGNSGSGSASGSGSGGGGGTVYNGPVYNYTYTVNRNVSNHSLNVTSHSNSTNNGLIVHGPARITNNLNPQRPNN